MQPLQPSPRRGLDRRGVRMGIPTLIALAALLAGFVGLGAVRAQDDAGFEGVTIEVFGSGAPSASPDNQLTLRRITFEPGASVPPHSHPGAVTFSVASGELAYTLVEGEASVQRAAVDGADGAVEPLLAGALTPLAVGDSLFVEGTIAEAANLGEEPAVLWASSLLTADEPFLIEEAADDEETGADADAEEPDAPTAAAEAEEPDAEGVRVSLDEFTIRLSSEISAGETTFVITNRGAIYHSFAIVGEGVEAALETPLAPGETAELRVDLPAGTYQIVCPVANHESLGMTRELVVTDDGDSAGGGEEADAANGEATAVEIAGFLFGPAALEIPVGTTVTWANLDAATHTVTAADGSFDSGPIASGGSFSFTFETPGEFAYACAIHPAMVGSVTVT